MVWKPRDSDQAKIGLANGQPGSDTKVVGAGFPGHKSQQMTLVSSPAPGLLFAGGHFLDTAFQAITTY